MMAEYRSKRRKLATEIPTNDGAKCWETDGEQLVQNANKEPALPPELWARVINFLNYRSVLSCAATSRMLLRDAMPLVTDLHVRSSYEMNVNVASRFRDVRKVMPANCSLLLLRSLRFSNRAVFESLKGQYLLPDGIRSRDGDADSALPLQIPRQARVCFLWRNKAEWRAPFSWVVFRGPDVVARRAPRGAARKNAN